MKGLVAATVLTLTMLVGAVPPAAPAAAEETPESILVGPDGVVVHDPGFSGPQITEVRLINEGAFLEVHWDRYVDEEAAVSPENLTLINGDREITLRPKPASGPMSTIFFDRRNRQIAATPANSMARLPQDLHLASIAYTGSVDPSQPLTLTVAGSAIEDDGGAPARDAVYTGVPVLDYYTQAVTTGSGVVVKANPSVAPATLDAAAAQVDVLLARTETGIADRMAAHGCSLAVYASLENAYLVPEHRGGYDPASYEVEGFGGNLHNGCVSSVSERNVLRIRGAADRHLDTGYPNENILIHELAHAVRSVGIETLADPALSDELVAAYEISYLTGRWPNTYAISNSDEYFATLSTIWFDVMAEAPDWADGVRSPINTRAELAAYDPRAYELFTKIYPSDLTLPAPWDVPVPDVHHGDYREEPQRPARATAGDVDLGSDLFRMVTEGVGSEYQVDRFACDDSSPGRDTCLWFRWGDGVWQVGYDDGRYTISASDGSGVLAAVSDTEVRYRGIVLDPADPAQQWFLVPAAETTGVIHDGTLVNAANGRALTLDGRPGTSVPLTLAEPASATRWMLEDTTRSAAQGVAAYLLPVEVTFASGAGQHRRAGVLQQRFTLPSVTDVHGTDWTRPGDAFLGWTLTTAVPPEGAPDVLPADWTIPDGTTTVSLTAVWESDLVIGPEVAVRADTRCVAGRVVEVVRVSNESDLPVEVAISTVYGARTVTVAPDRAASVAVSTRQGSVPAGEASVTAGAGGPTSTVSYAARTCGDR